MNALLKGLKPMHPGAILREDVLPSLNQPKTEVARRLHVSRQTLYDILAEKNPVTPAIALRLAKLFGTTPEMWVNLQRNYDLRIEAEKDAALIREIEPFPRVAA